MGAAQTKKNSTRCINQQLNTSRVGSHGDLTQLSQNEIEALGEDCLIVQISLLNLHLYRLLSPDTRAAAMRAGECAFTFCSEVKKLTDYGISTKDNIDAIVEVKQHMHCISWVLQKLHAQKMLNPDTRANAVKAAKEGKLPLEILEEVMNKTAIQGIKNLPDPFILTKPILDIVASFFKSPADSMQTSEKRAEAIPEFKLSGYR